MKTYKKNLGETMYFDKSKSGLEVYYVPKKGFKKQYAIFATDFGSTNNNFVPIGEDNNLRVPDGIAHFLEHKLFEEKEDNIFDKFAEYGADVNAFTNFDQTAYLFTSTENFYKSLELLISFVQNPYFTDENIEKEKGIIEQEIKMYEDDANWRAYFNCLESMYFNHPVKIDVAGTVESIQKIDKDLLYRTYNTFYHPENMVLFIVGDLSFSEIMKTVNESERTDYDKLGKIQELKVKEPKVVKENFVKTSMLTSTPILYLGFKDTDLGKTGREEVKKDLITNITLDMLFGNSSVFYNQLYDEGLIDGNFGGYFSGNVDYGHSIVSGEVEKPVVVYERILKFLSGDIDDILKEEDFNRIKNDEIGNFLMGLDSIEFIANTGLDMRFSNFNALDYLDLLEEIKFTEVKARFREHFVEENIVLSIVNPIEE